MDSKGETEEKFSNHPCHRLSVPAAKRFWCRHCFEMFDDPISRWRHSKTCKNTGLSNLTRRKEQEATALEAYCESTLQKRPDDKHVILPNLNPRSTNKSYIGPKENNAVDLSCFICRKQFSTMEEMKEHVRVPCNKATPVSDDVFPFPTRSGSTPKASTSEIIYHGATSGQGASEAVYEFEEEIAPSAKRTPSPLDPSNLSSETMAAVEALNMMARSDKVNLTQFLNQLSEGGFVIEQAAGTSSGSDSQDREIVFTVQGDVGESGELLQHGGDITVEVAEDLIRMAQRVRVETVERVVEEQVQEEVVQEDLEHQTEVQYIQDQAQFIQEQPQYVEDQTQYIEQPQYAEEQPQFVQDQAQLIQVEPVQQQTEYVQAEPQFVQEQPQYVTEQSESAQPSTYTIMNVETGKEYTGQIVTEGQLSTIGVESLSENAQVLVVPVDQSIVTKQEPENLLSIPDGKRKLEEDVTLADGQVQVKLENGSQVKKICTEVVIEQNVSDSNVKEDAFEAKKKLQFFNEGLIVQEKCNKNSEPTEKNLEIKSKEPCENVKKLPEMPREETGSRSAQTSDTHQKKIFLDEIDGFFKPMTEEMIKSEETILDMSALMSVESSSPEEKMTVIKKKPCFVKHPPPSPKKLRSSSRKLVLTPKKKRLVEEKEKRNKKENVKEKVPNHKQPLKSVKLPETSIKTTIKKEPELKEPLPKPVEKPIKVKPQKQLKCRACEKVFNSLKLLQKHKTVPCVVKITRNLCQKILRPKRALPKPPEKKVIKKKVNKHDKDLKKPKLLPVGFRIQAQWIPCKRERKPSKGRGRPRKHSVHYERKKHILLPDRTIEVSSLSDKEQFFFELGLVCSEYILKEFRQPLPLPQPQTQIATSLTVSVDHDVSDKSPVDDISPPLLEKIEPSHLNQFESAQPPDLTFDGLEPPLLEPVIKELNRDAIKQEVDQDYSEVSHAEDSNRHFLDSFSSEDVSESQKDTAFNTVSMVKGGNASAEQVEDLIVNDNALAKAESSKRPNIIQQLKSTLKIVRSPQKPVASLSPKQKMPDFKPQNSPQSKRNLFETMCSGSNKTCANSPKMNFGDLSNRVQTHLFDNISSKKTLCSQRKCQSAHSSPKKTPNILLRRSVSESSSRERTESILDIVAKSMGIAVSDSVTSNKDQNESHRNEHSPAKATSTRSASDDQRFKVTNTSLRTCKKNLFENCETLLSLENSCIQNEMEHTGDTEKSFWKAKSKQLDIEKSSPSKPIKTPDTIQPLVSLSSSQTGQILVSPLKQDKYQSPAKNTSTNHRGVKRKLCDASTQCERVASTSPVKVMLGQLEHRLKLLKSALKTQTSVKSDSETRVKLKEKKDLLPELVSVLLKRGAGEPSAGSSENTEKNLPDVVRCVTENKNSIDQSDISEVNTNCVEKLTQENITCSPNGATIGVSNSLGVSNTENSSDCLSEFEQDDTASEDSTGSSKVTVQYINQLEPGMSNGVTYLLIQQEGVEDYLTSLGSDLDLDSGETIHAVTVEEEEILTESIPSKLYNSKSVSRTGDCEVFVNSSGY